MFDFDPSVSGENMTPTAKKATAVMNRVIQPMIRSESERMNEVVEELKQTRSPVTYFFYFYLPTHGAH